MPTITAFAATQTNLPDGTYEGRVYCGRTFMPLSGSQIWKGALGSNDIYTTFDITALNGNLTAADFDLESTTDGTPSNSYYTVQVYTTDGRLITTVSPKKIYVDTTDPITWADLVNASTLANGSVPNGFSIVAYFQGVLASVTGTAQKMTTAIFGVGRLSVPAVAPSDPILVGDNDPRIDQFNPMASDFGAVGDGVTDDTAAIQACIDAAKLTVSPYVIIPSGLFKVTDTIEFDLPDGSTIDWRGTFVSNVSAKPAIRLGTTANRTYFLTVVGGIKVYRTAIDPAGSSIGIACEGLTWANVAVMEVFSFSEGIRVVGTNQGTSHVVMVLGAIHDNHINLRCTASGANGFCNEHLFIKGSFNHSTGYTPYAGTVNIQVDHFATSKLNNITFDAPSLEGNSDLTVAFLCHGESITLRKPRLEYSPGQATVQITFTTNSLNCTLRDKGFAVNDSNITDLGGNNEIDTYNGSRRSTGTAAAAARYPVAADPACLSLMSTSSNDAIGLMIRDVNDVPASALLTDGGAVFNGAVYLGQGFNFSTSSGTLLDRGFSFDTGSPEGVKTAEQGSWYVNLAGGAGEVFWVKESGGGNTGWVAYGRAPRVGTIASSATPTPTAAYDLFTVTALAANATFAAPTGTPAEGQSLVIRVKDNGTARTLAYNAIYRAIGITLPTTTVISKTLYITAIYNSADTKWDCVGYTLQA